MDPNVTNTAQQAAQQTANRRLHETILDLPKFDSTAKDIAVLPKAIMQLVASKDPATFTEAHDEAVRIQELTKTKNDQSTSAVKQKDKSVKQIKGNDTQNPYRGKYQGCGGQGG